MVYPWPNDLELSTSKNYQLLIDVFKPWLSNYGVNAELGEVEGAYCNGTFNLSINNKKIIGTAQRICRASVDNSNAKFGVLAHAFILINPNLTNLVDAVNQCYLQLGHADVFSRDAMTSLAEYSYDIEANYNKLASDLYQSAQSVIEAHLGMR
jgi:hypothetical protein